MGQFHVLLPQMAKEENGVLLVVSECASGVSVGVVVVVVRE